MLTSALIAFGIGAALALRFKIVAIFIAAPFVVVVHTVMFLHSHPSVFQFIFATAASLFSIQIGYFVGLILRNAVRRAPNALPSEMRH